MIDYCRGIECNECDTVSWEQVMKSNCLHSACCPSNSAHPHAGACQADLPEQWQRDAPDAVPHFLKHHRPDAVAL